MKKETVEILKNLSSINQGIVIREGDKLRTMSIMKNIFATAVVPDSFEKEFAIYDLNEFLSTYSLFDSPELSYKSDHVEMKSGRTRVKYFYSSPSVIVSPPVDKNIKVEGDFSFKLTASTLSELLKAAAVMKLKELEITTKGLRAFNKNSVGNQYDVTFEDAKGEATSKVLNIENLKMLSLDYNVVVGERAVKFTSLDGTLEYIIAIETE